MASGRHPSFCLLASLTRVVSHRVFPGAFAQSFKAALARCARGRFLPGLGGASSPCWPPSRPCVFSQWGEGLSTTAPLEKGGWGALGRGAAAYKCLPASRSAASARLPGLLPT